MTLRGIPFLRQPSIPVLYRERIVGRARPDFLVSECVVVELKTVDQIAPVHLAQAFTYLKTTHLRLALVINFNVLVLLQGVRRIVQSSTSPPT